MSKEVDVRLRRANLLTRDEQLEQLFGEDLSHRLLGRMKDLKEGRMSQTTTNEQHHGGETATGKDGRESRDWSFPHEKERRRRRSLAPVALAAALILLAGVPAGLFFTSSRASSVKVAESYIEAKNAYDAGRASALVAEGFVTSEPPDGFSDLEGMEVAFQQHEAYGFHYDDVDCQVANQIDGKTWVDCHYVWSSELHRIADHPGTDETLTFVIEDGLIEGVMRIRGDLSGWWEPWIDFLGAEYPDFRNVVTDALHNDPEATAELVDGLPQHLTLYEEWVAGQQN